MKLARYTKVTKFPQCQRLSACLNFWNVRPVLHGKGSKYQEVKAHRNGKTNRIKSQPESRLWDYYEASRKAWRKAIAKNHPDRGGDPQVAARLNALWDRTVLLFSRLGIGEQTE